MAIRLENVCPKCGSHLIIKEGENGDFLACPRFPSCKFTKPLPDNDLKIYQKPSPYCEKCNHTGLLPFIKNGKIIPNTFIDCECKLSQGEHYDSVKLYPEDFDFPMSDTFRACSFEYCRQPDPSYTPPLPEEHSIDKIQEPEWTKQQWDYIRQLKAQVLFLSDKVNKRLDKKQRKNII